ncbi:MAG: bifunctional phosphoribosyl-AMP cyclohydrolase/phosphoribosyl-ATP diphosphatase HisIE [Chromatiales bacterium]|nr:bifunctional phosphoribosyl-AMP cyclohydrolase/phosphoribosyl-ATP diphosphatase HisIE [Chromatiales bacterium]
MKPGWEKGLDWDKGEGLLPAIVQDARTGEVLMLAYMNAEALALTLKDKLVVFYSRSRQELWLKGETSGNLLELVSIAPDCDSDTLLVRVNPTGPVCHLGTRTCFDGEGDIPGGGNFLYGLEKVLKERASADPQSSYTAKLLQTGVKRIAQKVGEEGVEVALAGVSGGEAELLDESADLLYHLLVLLVSRGLSISQVVSVLQSRRSTTS